MATGSIPIDTGSTQNLATNTISEDAVTKHINRSIINDTAGNPVGVSANPIVVTASGVTIASITTGTVNVANTVAVTGTNFTIASITTGTVTIASVTTGLVSISGGIMPTLLIQPPAHR